MNEDTLRDIMKPARYIGEEWNVCRKDFAQDRIGFALCFPDLYELGMSNLGVRILYGILNGIKDVCCERCFAPADDLRTRLIERNEKLSSIESGKRLADFDFVGFSLGYELEYTNVLDMLELAGIPLSSSDRGASSPLIIGGGPCTVNPEPMHEFFDFFVIGEGEDVIVEIIDLYRLLKGEYKAGRLPKEELLTRFAGIEGVYVPSLYEADFDTDGRIRAFRPKKEGVPARVTKRFVADLDTAYFPTQWLVPYLQIVHDRLTLEVMRGCPNACRFCQARQQYYPFRQRSLNRVLELAGACFAATGYEEVALAGLSVSDYGRIEELLGFLVGMFRPKGVSVSLPSIKPRAMVGGLSSLIATIKKTGLTFAPEAATERLRSVLNKNFDMQDFQEALRQSYRAGYQHVKIYFMTGLPSEEEEDLAAILDFSNMVSQARRSALPGSGPAQVNISINTMIPKPHTPFQWLAMEGLEEMRRKQGYLKGRVRNKRLKLSFHNPEMSLLEGILSRGDRRLSKAIRAAHLRQARFDAWEDRFSLPRWLEAFAEAGIDPVDYLKARKKDEILPWDFLEMGVDKGVLLAEAP